MYVSCDFLPCCLLGSFVTFCCDGLSMFYFKQNGKNDEKKMDPVFKHPIFDSAREKVKRAMEQLEKSQETLENSYTCFKYGSNNVFSIAKQVRSADEGTSVFNECRECHNKWRDG